MDDASDPEREQMKKELAAVRKELAEMREELALVREAMARAIREQITSQAEPKGPSPN